MPASEKTFLIVLNAGTLIFTFFPDPLLIVERNRGINLSMYQSFMETKTAFSSGPFTTLQKSVS